MPVLIVLYTFLVSSSSLLAFLVFSSSKHSPVKVSLFFFLFSLSIFIPQSCDFNSILPSHSLTHSWLAYICLLFHPPESYGKPKKENSKKKDGSIKIFLLIFSDHSQHLPHLYHRIIPLWKESICESVYHFHWNSFESQWFPVKKKSKGTFRCEGEQKMCTFAALTEWVSESRFYHEIARDTVDVDDGLR